MLPIPQITPAQLDLLTRGVLVVDVREPDELATGRIPQSINIPLAELRARLRVSPSRANELVVNRPIVTVCRSGSRSNIAAELLAAAGFMVQNLDGGMTRWIAAGLPVA